MDSASGVVVPLRIRHVDSLRAIAAGLVMWAHLDQTLAPLAGRDPWLLGFFHALPHAMDLGRVGVMIFFAVSGFVICRSFGRPRAGGGRRFLIKRFCRLYPAFWVSMLGGVLVWWMMGQPGLTWRVVAANATMIPGPLGQPRLLGVYWTLEIELLFYGLCLGLYLARGLERPALPGVFVVFLAFLPRLLRLIDHRAGTHLGLSPGQPTLVLALAVMFWGAVFRMVYDETGGFRRGVFTHRGTAWLALLTLVLFDAPDPNLKWSLLGLRAGPVPAHVCVVCALVIFALWVAWLRVDVPLITYLGVISYSLYLFHPVMKYSVRQILVASPWVRGWNLPLSVYLLTCVVLSVVLAACNYRWVERPAIALGKRWAE